LFESPALRKQPKNRNSGFQAAFCFARRLAAGGNDVGGDLGWRAKVFRLPWEGSLKRIAAG